MSDPDIATINVAKLSDETNLPVIDAFVPITSDDDVEPFGLVDSFQALGVTALPFPPNEDGAAQAAIQRDVGNTDGVILGARDDRCASVVAAMKPGDTVLHACSPGAKAQVRCLADRKVVMATEDSGGQTAVIMLDGTNDKVQIMAFGGVIELNGADQTLSLVAPDGQTGIFISPDQIVLNAKAVMLGPNATAPVIIGTSPPGTPSTGVFA